MVSKGIRMAKLSARGGFNLFLGMTLSTPISAIGLILLLRLLDPTEYGLITVATIPTSLIGLFRGWVAPAMTKYLAQYRSENRTGELRSVLASGLLFESTMGILLSLISFFLAGFLAINVFHRPQTNLASLIEIASVMIFAQALLLASQSVFIGFERMEFYGLTMICQSTFRSLLAPLLVFLGYGTIGAVLGHTLSLVTTGIIGTALLLLVFYKRVHKTGGDGLNLGGALKTMLRYGWPIYISAILGGLLLQFYGFMMAIYCSDDIIGSYQAAVNFTVFVTFFTMPISTVLFPAFSKLNAEKETETLKTVFQYSVKYAALLAVPVTVAIMVLSKPLVFTLFPKYTHTPLFLTLYAISYLYSGLGSLSLANLLNGQGKTKVTMQLSLIGLSIGLPMSFMLIPRFGILGLIATTLTAGIPRLVLGLSWIRKHFGVTVDWPSSAKTYLASAAAAAVTYIIVSQLRSQDWVELLLGGTVFLITYLTTAPFMGAVKRSDINNLREMLRDLGPFTRLFNPLLSAIEIFLTIKEQIKHSAKPNGM